MSSTPYFVRAFLKPSLPSHGDGVVYRRNFSALGRMPTLNLGATSSAVALKAFASHLAPAAPHSKNKPVAIIPCSQNPKLPSFIVCGFRADFCQIARKPKSEIANSGGRFFATAF
jgi:hypothetical protein